MQNLIAPATHAFARSTLMHAKQLTGIPRQASAPSRAHEAPRRGRSGGDRCAARESAGHNPRRLRRRACVRGRRSSEAASPKPARRDRRFRAHNGDGARRPDAAGRAQLLRRHQHQAPGSTWRSNGHARPAAASLSFFKAAAYGMAAFTRSPPTAGGLFQVAACGDEADQDETEPTALLRRRSGNARDHPCSLSRLVTAAAFSKPRAQLPSANPSSF